MEANLRSVPRERGEEGDLTDDASFEEFYEANVRRVFTALCLVTGDRHEAEEIAQEAFVRVFSNAGIASARSRTRRGTCSGSR